MTRAVETVCLCLCLFCFASIVGPRCQGVLSCIIYTHCDVEAHKFNCFVCIHVHIYIYRLDDFCMFDHMISHVVVCYDMLFAVFGGVVNGHFVGTPSELVRP